MMATSSEATATSTPAQAIATSTPDGEYYAYVTGFKINGLLSVTLTLQQVTYFTGAEARVTAAHDVACPSGKIDLCVPTLSKGYYVRESSGLPFLATINLATKISLSTSTEALLKKNPTLEAFGSYKPVVVVTIKKGKTIAISEVTTK
jgi:hypothetical protein